MKEREHTGSCPIHNGAMDVGRFCGAIDGVAQATHQRIAEYVKPLCNQYHGLGFTPREEWVMEQTMQALQTLLTDVRCTNEERQAIEEFLALAAQEVPAAP